MGSAGASCPLGVETALLLAACNNHYRQFSQFSKGRTEACDRADLAGQGPQSRPLLPPWFPWIWRPDKIRTWVMAYITVHEAHLERLAPALAALWAGLVSALVAHADASTDSDLYPLQPVLDVPRCKLWRQ